MAFQTATKIMIEINSDGEKLMAMTARSKSPDASDEVSYGDALSSNTWLTQEKLNQNCF
jgi:hypothetical protein